MTIDKDSYLYLIPLWPLAGYITWRVWNSGRKNRYKHLILRSQEWTEIKGTVVNAEAGWAHVEVTYQYCVKDKQYVGAYIVSLTPRMVDRTGASARAISNEVRLDIAAYAPGSGVVIRFNPELPEESVLILGEKNAPDDEKMTQVSLANPGHKSALPLMLIPFAMMLCLAAFLMYGATHNPSDQWPLWPRIAIGIWFIAMFVIPILLNKRARTHSG